MQEILMQTYTIALPVVLGYIVWLLQNQKKSRDANSRGTMLLLRVQLIEYHSKYTKRGNIPSYAYENFNEMYSAYHDLGGEATFGFDEAIKYLKRGMKVKRKGWNGKDQYIELATNVSFKTPNDEVVNVDHADMGNKAIAFHGTSGVQLGWLASQSDMLSEDWTFVEEN